MNLHPDADGGLRLVEAALREDPGFRLDPGFADRVAHRALGVRHEIPWLENAAVVLLFVGTLWLSFSLVAGYVLPIMTRVLSAAGSALAPWEAVRWDLLLGAACVLTIVGMAEKFAAPRPRRRLPG